MTPRADALGRRFAADLEDLKELDRTAPDDAEAIRSALVAHLASWCSQSITPLDAGFVPTEPICRDPRD